MNQAITCEIKFPMGHALHEYAGRCNSLHGHNYTVEAVVRGTPDAMGLVADYGTLRANMQHALRHFDHTMVLHHQDPRGVPLLGMKTTRPQRLITLSRNPSAEHLAQLWYKILLEAIGPSLVHVSVRESDHTSAFATACDPGVYIVEAANVQ